LGWLALALVAPLASACRLQSPKDEMKSAMLRSAFAVKRVSAGFNLKRKNGMVLSSVEYLLIYNSS
jgi:hypothetical protein